MFESVAFVLTFQSCLVHSMNPLHALGGAPQTTFHTDILTAKCPCKTANLSPDEIPGYAHAKASKDDCGVPVL